MAIRARDLLTLTTLPTPSYVRMYYNLQPSTASAPSVPATNPPPSPWTTIEPSYAEGSTNTLYTVMLTAYGSVSFEYGPVQKSSSYEAAKTAYNKAVNATTVANLADAAAKGLIKFSQSDPGHLAGGAAGRIWFQLDSNGNTIGIKYSTGAAWTSYTLMADQILVPGTVGSVQIKGDALNFWEATGFKINAGEVRGSTIISPSSTNPEEQIELSNNQLTVTRSDIDGPYSSLSIGGANGDSITLLDPNNSLKVGIYGDNGDAYFAGSLDSPDLRLNGDPVTNLLGALPQGIIAKWEKWSDWHQAGSAEIGVAELYSDRLLVDHIYRIVFDGLMRAATPGDIIRMFLRARESSPDDPATVSSAMLNLADYPTSGTQFHRVHFETIHRPLGRTSFLFTMKNQTANRAINLYARGSTPAVAYIEDLGKRDYNVGNDRGVSTLAGGTPFASGGSSGSDDTAATHTKIYSPIWKKVWYGSSTSVTDTLHHGYYGGVRRYSMVGFGGTMASDLSGATVLKAEIYLVNEHWWGSTGTAYLSPSNAASAPANVDNSGGVTTSSGWPKGGGRWVPINWGVSSRAVTIGNGAPASNESYGKFVWGSPQLRLTYRK